MHSEEVLPANEEITFYVEEEMPPSSKDPVSNDSLCADHVDRDQECCDAENTEECSRASGKTDNEPTNEEIEAAMNYTFHERRRHLTRKHPRITELKRSMPYLFKERQILREFERITGTDVDSRLEIFSGFNTHGILEVGQCLQNENVHKILRQAIQLKGENPNFEEYWNMVASLYMLPELLGESNNDLVKIIPRGARIDPVGIIVPTLISRGNVFSSSYFAIIIEQERVAIFPEFTLALANLFASFWVFNMLFPANLSKTFCFIQNVMVGLKDSNPLPRACRKLERQLEELKNVKPHEGSAN